MSEVDHHLTTWSWQDSDQRPPNGAVSRVGRNSLSHVDFLSFLAVVQQLDLDILPITWNDGLNSVGVGGTAILREAMVDLTRSFAFKHLKGGTSDQRQRSFSPLINEVMILGQPSFRSHPNIITLEGICWHTPQGELRVEPLLVFEKAPHKDLYSFMKTAEGKMLEFSERLNICLDIATALHHGHEHGVIHGDVKPENVVIFGNDGNYTAQVIDYGYASIVSSGSITPIISRPWEAPEIQQNQRDSPVFGVEAAKQAEAYSFGLLCLWLLFHDSLLTRNEENLAPFAYNGDLRLGSLYSTSEPSQLQQLKRCGTICTLAKALLASSLDIPRVPAFRLGRVFDGMLALDPQQRMTNFETFVTTFKDRDQASTHETAAKVIDMKPHFKVFESLGPLVQSHLIVRKYIVRSFRTQYETSQCADCRINAAFQLWFCTEVGFGNPPDDYATPNWARLSLSPAADREQAMRTAKCTVIGIRHRSAKIQEFDAHGYLLDLEYASEHIKTPMQEVLDRDYPQEIRRMSEKLGKRHILMYTLRNEFGAILYRQAAYNQALHPQELLYEDLANDPKYGPDHVLTQKAAILLASIHWALAAWDKAAEVETKIIERWKNTLGEDNIRYIHLLRSHANTRRAQGQHKDAEALERQALRLSTKLLGDKQSTTLSIMANLAVTLSDDGRYAEAEVLETEVLAKRVEVLGARHRDTVMAKANLAYTYRDLHRWRDAELLERQVLDDRINLFGEDHPETLRAMINLANTHMNQGYYGDDTNSSKWEEARARIVPALEMSRKAHGDDHPDTLMAMSSLAACYRNTGRCEEARDLDEQLVTIKTASQGPNHPGTLKSVFNLAQTYREMGDYENARTYATKAFEGRKSELGSSHPLTLDIVPFLDSLNRGPLPKL